MKWLWLCLILGLISNSARSQEDPAAFGITVNEMAVLGGLEVGDAAPEITANIRNEPFLLSQALKKGKVLLVFYRGYWCGVCNRHLEEFEEDLSKLTDRGIQVIAVSPEETMHVDKTMAQTGTSIPVISDFDGKIMKDYKVFYEVADDYIAKLNKYIQKDLAEVNGQEKAALPVPATYLINQNQKVEFVHYDINYRNRANVQDVLNALEKIENE